MVPDHKVWTGQREEGRALQVGETGVQRHADWRLQEAQTVRHGLELLSHKDSHERVGGDQMRKDFGDCGQALRLILQVIWRKGVNERDIM